TGTHDLELAVSGEIQATDAQQSPQAPAGSVERRYTITGGASAKVRGKDDLVWNFAAIPDRAPTIALAKEPEAQGRGSLSLTYKIEDDYGVVDAQATFALKDPEKAPERTPHPFSPSPDLALTLPQTRTRNGVGQMIKDITEHPWAGVDVVMTLTARDEANNEGRSEPHELRLPERPFTKPVAR